MNAVSLILYAAAALAGVFLLTRLLVRALKLVLILAVILFVVSWVRFSHTPICSPHVTKHLPAWTSPLCKSTDISRRN